MATRSSPARRGASQEHWNGGLGGGGAGQNGAASGWSRFQRFANDYVKNSEGFKTQVPERVEDDTDELGPKRGFVSVVVLFLVIEN